MLSRAVTGLLGAVLVVVASGIVAVTLVLPHITGGAAMTVLSGSMTPALPVGSVAVVRPVDTGAIEAGDVITYLKGPTSSMPTTHRVVEVTREMTETGMRTSFITKGDANDAPDAHPVPAEAVQGELWFHVPWLGTLRDLGSSPAGLTATGMIAVGVLIGDPLKRALSRRRATVSQQQA